MGIDSLEKILSRKVLCTVTDYLCENIYLFLKILDLLFWLGLLFLLWTIIMKVIIKKIIINFIIGFSNLAQWLLILIVMINVQNWFLYLSEEKKRLTNINKEFNYSNIV